MEVARPTFWNVPNWVIAAKYVCVVASLIVFAAGVLWRTSQWRSRKLDPRTASASARLKQLALDPLFPRRCPADLYGKVMYLAISWGVLIPFLAVPVVTVDWYVSYLLCGFQFLRGGWFFASELVLEVFGLVLIVGLAMAACRRFWPRATGLQASGEATARWDSPCLWTLLLVITVSGFVEEALRLAAGDFPGAAWTPVGASLAILFRSVPESVKILCFRALWLSHIALAYVFLASLPFAKCFNPGCPPATGCGRVGTPPKD